MECFHASFLIFLPLMENKNSKEARTPVVTAISYCNQKNLRKAWLEAMFWV